MQPQSYLVISMTYPLPVLFVSNLLLSSYFIIADVNYGWLSAKFSDGNFKTVSMVSSPSNPAGNKPTSLRKLLLCLALMICSRVHKKAVYECFNDSLLLNSTFPWKLASCALKNIACWTLQNRSSPLAFRKVQDLCLRYTSQPRKC